MANFTVLETEAGPALKVAASDLSALGLSEGSTLAASFVGEEIVLRRLRRRVYTADELLAQSDYSLPMSDEDREWLNSPPVGRELI